MKPYILILSLLMLCACVKAQSFYVINDPDGYVNIRQNKNVKSAIVGKINAGEVVTIYEDDTKATWIHVASPTYFTSYPNGKSYEYGSKIDNPYAVEGYVYGNRIIPIEKLQHINRSNRQETANTLVLKNDSVVFSFTTQPFRPKQHKIDGEQNMVSKVDGKYIYGQDGGMPKVEIANISISVNGIPVVIPHSAYGNLFEPRIDHLNIYFDDKGYIYICMPLNSDGAGGYSVLWVVKDGKLIKRYVDNSYA